MFTVQSHSSASGASSAVTADGTAVAADSTKVVTNIMTIVVTAALVAVIADVKLGCHSVVTDRSLPNITDLMVTISIAEQ